MTDPTFPAALVEQVARAIFAKMYSCDPMYYPDALDALGNPAWMIVRDEAVAALSALPAGAQAVARGEAMAVPRATLDRIECTLLRGDYRNGVTDSTGSIDEGDERAGEVIDEVRAMLAASPYAQEPDRRAPDTGRIICTSCRSPERCASACEIAMLDSDDDYYGRCMECGAPAHECVCPGTAQEPPR